MDEILKDRILQGDLDAYGEIVRRYQGMLMSYALRRLSDWSLAEEVVQLTFIRSHQKLEEFDSEKDFGVWLCVTCKYLIMTELEKRRRETSNKTKYRDELELELLNTSIAPSESEPGAELSALKLCISKLKSEAASLVEFRYFGNKSCQEIANEKGRTITWVTSNLSRVRKSLRTCLESQSNPSPQA